MVVVVVCVWCVRVCVCVCVCGACVYVRATDEILRFINTLIFKCCFVA